MKLLCPRVLTGLLTNQNKSAFDWGFQGFLAYGCENVVVVVDPKTVQVIQALEKHRSAVVKVKWARENYLHDTSSPYSLRLASADATGHIIVWSVTQATTTATFSDGPKPVQDMHWLTMQDTSHDLLAVLHPPHSFILWNADTGTPVWKKTYAESLISFSFDPFDPARIVFLSQESILLIDDFNIHKTPSSNGRKFYISNSMSSSSSTGSIGGGNSGAATEKKGSARQLLRNKVKSLVMQEGTKSSSKPEETSTPSVMLTECLQLVFHPAYRHCLLLVYQREILIIDFEMKQTVGIIPVERTGSPFVQIYACQQRDILACLHENGAVTWRVRRIYHGSSLTPNETGGIQQEGGADVIYELRCQSDPMRLSKNARVFSIQGCPVTETRFSLLLGDGRLLFWDLKTIEHSNAPHAYNQPILSPLLTPGATSGTCSIPESWKFPYKANMRPPRTTLCDMISSSEKCMELKSSHEIGFKAILTGLLSGTAPPPLILRMCPPLTTKNWNVYKPYLAAGTTSGIIHIFNLSTGALWKEFGIHSCAVRGIEWVSLTKLISYAYPSPLGNNSLVKNELLVIDINTGRTKHLRGEKSTEESPIEFVRVSYLKQYVVIVFKDAPLELWDLRTYVLLRQMPRNFPVVTALEWSPSASVKNLKRRHESQESTGSGAGVADPQVSPTGSSSSRQENKAAAAAAKEHFVFTDNDSQLYHFVVEGNSVKEGSKIPADSNMGSITCIAWKGDTMVLADSDGNLSIWDLKARISRAVPTHRGWIKKARFAPGRGNMKLLILYNDGVDIWDAKEVELISSVKTPKDLPKVHDAEWAASDRPILATDDGCVRVFDMMMIVSCSPIQHYETAAPVFSPYLQPAKVSLSLQYHLQHQPWRDCYTLEMTELADTKEELTQRIVNEQIDIIDSNLRSYLPGCMFGVAERCLITARLFGDESEINFWQVALHYLRAEKAKPMNQSKGLTVVRCSNDIFVPRDTSAHDVADLVDLDNKELTEQEEALMLWNTLRGPPLDTCWDIMTDFETYQKYMLERLALRCGKYSSYDLTQQCAEEMILLGQADQAVHLLLETDADNENYYVDSLRACLVATIRSSGASQSTIKLVATNLIANGKLSEGIQLLCLIDKGLDACRYLQSYGQWNKAASLAKSTLDYRDCAEVMRRWVEHLCSPTVNLKSKAVLVLLSLGQFKKVIEMLYNMRHFNRAALFIEACLEFGLMQITEDNRTLIESVYLEYARYLSNLHNKIAALHYSRKAGEKGQQLCQELEILFENSYV